MKVAVLGGGLWGLSCLFELRKKGIKSFLLEADSRLGGLAKTRIVNGYVYDLHGGHVFNSKHDDIRDWVFALLSENNWELSERVAKIKQGNKLMSYPFEYALWQLPIEETVDCIADLAESRRGKEPDVFDEWLIWAFGKSIAQKYLLPYNRKIWRCDLSEISSHWVHGKMPIPTVREVLYSTMCKNANESNMPHSFFYYPESGGIQSLIDSIASHCIDFIQKDVTVNRIEKDNDNWLINGKYSATHIISTIPVDRLIQSLLNVPNEIREAAAALKANPLTTVLCSRAKPTNISWLYLPSTEHLCHRIVYQGELSTGSCPSGQSSAIYEVTCSASAEQVLENIRESQVSEITYDDILDTSYTEYAYPVYDLSFEKNISIINSWLDKSGIRRCGRFAEWRYYNMDICIKRAIEEVAELVCKFTST